MISLPADADGIARAVACLRAGGLVALPTETVYGLAADAGNAAAVARIYAAKGRPQFNPLICHIADPGLIDAYAEADATAQALARAFWPGPLTLVLPAQEPSPVSPLARAGLATLALRCPAHPVAQAVLAAFGGPLVAPSANASGALSPTSAAHVVASLGDRVDLVLDAGPTSRGLESTIVRVEPGRLVLLRPGPIAPDALTTATGLDVMAAGDEGITAPGQLASHYAPRQPVLLNVTGNMPDAFHIGFGPVAGDCSLSECGDPIEAASRLFAVLHMAQASDRAVIAVAPIPETGLGIAINDRLRRAAAPR